LQRRRWLAAAIPARCRWCCSQSTSARADLLFRDGVRDGVRNGSNPNSDSTASTLPMKAVRLQVCLQVRRQMRLHMQVHVLEKLKLIGPQVASSPLRAGDAPLVRVDGTSPD